MYNNESVTVYETLDGKGLKNGTPHSRYFSDELGVPNFLIKTQNKCLLLRKMNFHMVEDMYILYNTVLFVESVVLCSYRK